MAGQNQIEILGVLKYFGFEATLGPMPGAPTVVTITEETIKKLEALKGKEFRISDDGELVDEKGEPIAG